MRCCGSAKRPHWTWPTCNDRSDGSGTVTITSSKTDQEGRGYVRYLGAPTMQRLAAWLSAAGITTGGPCSKGLSRSGRGRCLSKGPHQARRLAPRGGCEIALHPEATGASSASRLARHAQKHKTPGTSASTTNFRARIGFNHDLATLHWKNAEEPSAYYGRLERPPRPPAPPSA